MSGMILFVRVKGFFPRHTFLAIVLCTCMCIIYLSIYTVRDLQGHLEAIEEQLSRQKQALKEASAKYQVYIAVHYKGLPDHTATQTGLCMAIFHT